MKITLDKIPLLILALIIGGWSHSARADQPIGLIQTLCIPEPGVDYFSARLQSFNEIANYDLSYDTHQKVLEKYGLLPEDEFSYSCKLLNHTYTITGHRPPFREKGMCGGDPRVTITLKQGDEIILDDVFFEQSCFSAVFPDSHPYVESFSVEDGDNGAHDQYVEVVLSDGTAKKTFHLGGNLKSLSHDQLYCLEQNKFLKTKGRFVVSQQQLETYENCRAPLQHHVGGR
jgi:hypothetical protein